MHSSSRKTFWIAQILFFLATAHCVRSIFFVNITSLSLVGYEKGVAFMPYQGRVGMMPILAWAARSHAVARGASFLNASYVHTLRGKVPYEAIGPEKFISIVVGFFCMYAVVLAAAYWGRLRMPKLWFLVPGLFLLMLYTGYAARSEQASWYPYDLPHYMLFGLATLCAFEGLWVPMFCLFLLDIPMRETSIYLVPFYFVLASVRGVKERYWVAAAMLTVCVPARLLISYHFRLNPSDTGIHLHQILTSFVNPLHWPQIASAFGFMAVPLWMGRGLLTKFEKATIYAALPCIAVTLLFGVWFETRIFGEWTLIASVLLALECNRYLNLKGESGGPLFRKKAMREHGVMTPVSALAG